MNPSPYPAPFPSAHVRARIVKILLIVGAIATGMSLVAEVISLMFPPLTDEQELADNPGGVAILFVTFLLAILELIIYVATVVFFLMWLYRAADNLRAFDRTRVFEYTPTWAVGSWFIPFANLVIPYRAVKEVWQKSGLRDEAFLSEPSPPATFALWWTFWLLSSFAGNAAMRLSFDENVPVENATIVSIIASVLSIIAAVFAYSVVDAIDQRQEETSGRLFQKFSSPPPPPTNLSMPEVVAPAP